MIKKHYKLFSIVFLLGCAFVLESSYSQSKYPYASDKPLPYPKLFNINGVTSAWHITFEPDGNVFYFLTDSVGLFEIIKSSNFQDGKWSYPLIPDFSGKTHVETPCISPDGNKFFFAQNTPPNRRDNENIYVMDKTETGWSEPKELGAPINSNAFESSPSIAVNGNLYFNSNRNGRFQIFCSKFENNQYSTPELIGNNINKYLVYTIFIAPDESYILFDRDLGSNNIDIYISFRENGSWTKAKSLGPRINTNASEGRACVSPDGNYLFFSRGSGTGPSFIYQIDWKPILDSLRNVSLTTDVENSAEIYCSNFSLNQNYPNPFNPETVISYTVGTGQLPENPLLGEPVPTSRENEKSVLVILKVYNILGSEVATLVNEERIPGNYQVKFDGRNLSSGIYFYRLTAGKFTAVKKLMLMK